MSRKATLTWQSGVNGQAGRYRKKYNDRIYYFPGGNGKSDREAYKQAIAEWESLKITFDQ